MVRTSGFHPDNRGSIPLGDGVSGKEQFLTFFFNFSRLSDTTDRMKDIGAYISIEMQNFMHTAIADAGGNEVFILGQLNDTGVIFDAVVAARGNKTAVPATSPLVEKADVVLHNHPSGILQPSEADLDIAAQLARSGTGFYIVNNSVTNLYVVAEPVLLQNKQPLDEKYVGDLLDETGTLASIKENYEPRPSQIALARAVARAFNTDAIGVFEAGTGVGKSFAYLIPAMLWATDNHTRVIISTGTINLQQQLIEKDIPTAQKIIGREVKSVLLKGRQNYICRRRLSDTIKEPGLFDDETEELERISAWVETTSTGTRSDMSFMPTESVWSRICSESDSCMGMWCPLHEKCFILQARKEAADASILIVNHHLFFADIEARMTGAGYDDTAVLPPFHHIVFDEAHAMEEAATSFFSENFNRFRLSKHLSLLYRVRRGAVAGHLITLEKYSVSEPAIQSVIAGISDIKDAMSQTEDAALQLLGPAFTWRLSLKTGADAVSLLNTLTLVQKKIAALIDDIHEILDGVDEDYLNEPAVRETKFALRHLNSVANLCRAFCDWEGHPESVFWIEKKRLSGRQQEKGQFPSWYPRFVQTPLHIADMMKEGVFDPLDSVVCTSATLRIASDFSWWMRRTGVSLMDEQRIQSGVYDSPFPYDSQVLFAIPDDAPLPDSADFQPYIENALVSLLEASSGHALVLFTSYESLRSACETARRRLASFGITILKQGDDERSRLLDMFLADETSVLFATDSFWTGVDAPGNALLHVIIVKLPFRVPDDPVHAARTEAITQEGGNSFMELSLPEAVIRFRQGFGRLMRRKTDRGVVTVLDRRLLAKRYGRLFIESVPETVRCFAPLSAVTRRIEEFLIVHPSATSEQ